MKGNKEASSDIVTNFDSFGVENILKEKKRFIGIKITTTNIYRMQAYDSVMCQYFCIDFLTLYFRVKA